MDKIRALYNSERFLTIALLLWLVTMPFGAFVGSISLGMLTVYPNLIITLLLLPLFFFTLKNWSRIQWVFALILLFLLIQSVVWVALNGLNENAIFDIRSLIFYGFFTVILFSLRASKHWENLKLVLTKGVRYYFVIVLVAGIIEFFTGMHLVGTFTEKLATQPVNENFYAPVFIYDNPNTYLTYLLGFFALLNVLDAVLRKNFLLKIVLLLIIFVFALYASARFVIFVSCFWMLVEFLFELKKIKFSGASIWILAGIVGGGLLVAKHSVFLGPKYSADSKKYVVNGLQVVVEDGDSISIVPAREIYPIEKHNDLVEAYYRSAGPFSDNLRKNLILNGWQFIKEKPVFGIGPGQYRQYLDDKKGKYSTGTLHSPHNYVIEMWSQFGLTGVIYFLFCGFLLVRLMISRITFVEKKSYLLAFFTFGILMMVPSGFLLLDLNWMFIPMVLISASVLLESKTENKNG